MIDISAIPASKPLKIILGAGEQSYPDWISTNKAELDLCDPDSWKETFHTRKADAFLCEHVWEHLTEDEGRLAAKLCYKYLKPGGFIRCAVPDAFFPNEAYQKMVQIGGPGASDHPAADHKIVYNFRLFMDIFEKVGFTVDLLEYCDEIGRFHYNQWNMETGLIYRSLLSDHRNKEGKINFASLIIDARKPLQKNI